MNIFIKRLPLVAFVLAAVFAFTKPLDPSEPRFGFDGENWYDVTGLTEGIHYRCNAPLTPVCLRNEPNLSSVPIKNGEFEPLGIPPMGEYLKSAVRI